ncbi:13976_t:CDS:2 [Funneliformis caledonium]|uniref:13976_t:CDS:1 n=1 Tax=Funneliformis caledonium TaxID=1117310 RepID=A0A9N9BN45_9GLOM|nr:13976_t:CDS:2 [Funneliformis caledonium]
MVTYRDWEKYALDTRETKDSVWVMFDDGSQEICDILVGVDGINFPARKQRQPELQIFDIGLTNIITYQNNL